MQSTKSPRRATQRLAAGTLMTALFLGATAGTALAAEPVQVNLRSAYTADSPAVVSSAATGSMTSSANAVKGTPVNWFEYRGIEYTRGMIAEVGLIWAVAATVVMAGIMAGTLWNRRGRR